MTFRAAAPERAPSGAAIQDQVNRRVYHSSGIARQYLWPELVRVEAMALLAYQPAFAHRDVLDLGVGTGRTTRFIAPLARRYECIDYSPFMVEYMRTTMPAVSVHLGDMRELSDFETASFDFVLGSNNVISAVPHEGRMKTLNEVHRVLRPGGVFMFNAHNRRYRFAMQGPRLRWSRNPVTQVRNTIAFARSLVNHRRVGKLRHVEAEYALLNDGGHEYALLHYYIERKTQEGQLAGVRFRVLEVFSEFGHRLGRDDSDDDSTSLMYVAQRLANEDPSS